MIFYHTAFQDTSKYIILYAFYACNMFHSLLTTINIFFTNKINGMFSHIYLMALQILYKTLF